MNTSADTDDGFCDLLGQGVGNQDCTLREAMTAANNTNDESEITFAADYTITLVGSQLPAVTTAITITGNGEANTIILSVQMQLRTPPPTVSLKCSAAET